MTRLAATPGQTVGPFFHDALPFVGDSELVPPGRADAIRLHGLVLDGAGDPVPDALVEVWQAGPDGAVVQEPGSLHRDGWTFTGWGRSSTDGVGRYSFSTVAPGATEAGSAAFFVITVFARGLLDRLFTRAYLPGDPALSRDAWLNDIDPDRRRTLIAAADTTGFTFDIHLQGDDETVFLTYPGHRQAD
ncbi:MAG: protocatechuate 3,4-dioxygenase subunit alpha [Aeromicrobium sp.]